MRDAGKGWAGVDGHWGELESSREGFEGVSSCNYMEGPFQGPFLIRGPKGP